MAHSTLSTIEFHKGELLFILQRLVYSEAFEDLHEVEQIILERIIKKIRENNIKH